MVNIWVNSLSYMKLLLSSTLLAGVALPAWAGPLPTKIGSCARSSIKEIGYRLSSPDKNGVYIPVTGSGTSITYLNGGYQVSYEMVSAIFNSREKDPVEICLGFIPECHHAQAGDMRGRSYLVKNLRTGKTWELPDSQHVCGGA